jgi:hypothetical protein
MSSSNPSASSNFFKRRFGLFKEVYDAFERSILKVREELEKEFRQILGVDSSTVDRDKPSTRTKIPSSLTP